MVKKKALIAMSGGVDSAVAAKLMLEAGYDCIGATMYLHHFKETSVAKDIADARAICEGLGIPHHVVDYCDAFTEKVIRPFALLYEQGLTPNPCVMCNKQLKFGLLFDEARRLGCDYMVTGHYARIEKTAEGYIIRKALDSNKDQSYVLYNLTQAQLAHIILPLGDRIKEDIRRSAAEDAMPAAGKAESQDICFVDKNDDYANIIAKYGKNDSHPGDFVDESGHVLGRHRGIVNYTIGQRKGLGLSLPAPGYVKEIDAAHNRVIISSNEALFAREVIVGEVNWLSGKELKAPLRCEAKLRYRQPARPAKAEPLGNGRIRLLFDGPERAVTPGQSAVMYDGDVLLGGGVIVKPDC